MSGEHVKAHAGLAEGKATAHKPGATRTEPADRPRARTLTATLVKRSKRDANREWVGRLTDEHKSIGQIVLATKLSRRYVSELRREYKASRS